ncbi:MAG TPA: hypothetical protein VHG91_04180 [Longimicrobium sp.]|nr:hypothetical protein [Longimicrobium sp.]
MSCPRCGWSFPWYRSRRWKPDFSHALGLAVGKRCPRCDRPTTRRRSPLWLKPLRVVSLHRCSYRTCDGCGWRGAAFHGRGHEQARRRREGSA